MKNKRLGWIHFGSNSLSTQISTHMIKSLEVDASLITEVVFSDIVDHHYNRYIPLSRLPVLPLGSASMEDEKKLLRNDKYFSEYTNEVNKYGPLFKESDVLIVAFPMWNFSIPYKLKLLIDIVTHPGHLFKFTEKGPEGLSQVKQVVVVMTSGGFYDKEPTKSFDMASPYLLQYFSFIGVKQIDFVKFGGVAFPGFDPQAWYKLEDLDRAMKSMKNAIQK